MIRALVATLLLLSAAPAFAQAWGTIFSAAAPGVVRVQARDDDGAEGICSGVVINTDAEVVLTAAHCVPDSERFSMTVGSKHADVRRINRILDLAILKTSLPKNARAIRLAAAAPLTGDPVAIIGYAFGSDDLSLQIGVVANPLQDDAPQMWINADILPGQSGGAAVSRTGELLGITTAIRSLGPAHMGMGVDLDTVRSFIENYIPAEP